MVSIERLILKQMITDERNHSLSDGLAQFPLPEYLRIGFRKYSIPKDLEEYSDSICYGQRLSLSEPETNDFGIIIRFITRYYYPIVKRKPFDDEKAARFGKNVLYLKVKDLYPIAMHLVKLHSELIEKEQKMLHREPTKQEKAAGIEELSIFSELTAIKFLRDALQKSSEQVMLTPYNDCLVEFYHAKKQNAFNERLTEVYKKEAETKHK